MELPRVSIVIPCLDAARFLEQALDSALAQTHPRCEVVAVDDGSRDGTRVILERHAGRHAERMKLLIRDHAGVSAARNAGVDAASGEYLLFLDADDVLEPDAVERLLDRALSLTPWGAVGNWRMFIEGSERSLVTSARPHYPDDAYASWVRALMFHTAVLVRRPGTRWNEARSVWEALEYVLHAAAPFAGAAHLDQVVVHVRQHDSPERFSTRHDHFEPGITGAFFADEKALLARQRLLHPAREEALDQRIVANAWALVRAGRRPEALSLLSKVSWERIPGYDWYRPDSFVGVLRLLGPRIGSAAFYRVNRALGRL